MIIEIDKHSGFCFGVQRAISQVEDLLSKGEEIYCLGDIVHNHEEVERLEKLGMKTVSQSEIPAHQNKTLLFRTHGEPPSTYQNAKDNYINLVDATCPVVLKLQQRVKTSFEAMEAQGGKLLIYGKKGHAEVIGLLGQTQGKAIVVTTPDDLSDIDFNRPIELYSQTTMPLDGFHQITNILKEKTNNQAIIHDTICRQVSNRIPRITEFAKLHDLVLFVAGTKSSNGKLLFEVCKKANSNSHFISSPNEVDSLWLANIETLGICGATSTPQWLMEQVAEKISSILNYQ
jgi:4-hydroxy-3-methylbut-2-en-1-yl diphosphate reductase